MQLKKNHFSGFANFNLLLSQGNILFYFFGHLHKLHFDHLKIAVTAPPNLGIDEGNQSSNDAYERE